MKTKIKFLFQNRNISFFFQVLQQMILYFCNILCTLILKIKNKDSCLKIIINIVILAASFRKNEYDASKNYFTEKHRDKITSLKVGQSKFHYGISIKLNLFFTKIIYYK